MKANELRIGNWVKYKDNMYQIYDGIRSLSIDDLDNEGLDSHLKNIKIFDLKPIKLTEEILLKCGFERDNGVMCYTVDDFSDVKIVYETLANYYRLYPYTYKIKYLHDLQNIFYFTTNKELDIKL